MTIEYLELTDYLAIAVEVTGLSISDEARTATWLREHVAHASG